MSKSWGQFTKLTYLYACNWETFTIRILVSCTVYAWGKLCISHTIQYAEMASTVHLPIDTTHALGSRKAGDSGLQNSGPTATPGCVQNSNNQFDNCLDWQSMNWFHTIRHLLLFHFASSKFHCSNCFRHQTNPSTETPLTNDALYIGNNHWILQQLTKSNKINQ